jgi:hypothetical protein
MVSNCNNSVPNTKCHNYQDMFHSQECHVRRGVTQLLVLLFPSATHRLKPLEAVLVCQHFFVLKCLMENVTRVQDYVQEQFEEEFRLVTRKAEIRNRIMSRRSYLTRIAGLQNGLMFRYISSRGWSQKVNSCSTNFRSNNRNTINSKIGLSLGITRQGYTLTISGGCFQNQHPYS